MLSEEEWQSENKSLRQERIHVPFRNAAIFPSFLRAQSFKLLKESVERQNIDNHLAFG